MIITCPFATFEDLQESAYLMEYSIAVRPYILEWYNDVFLIEFNGIKPRRSTLDSSDGEVPGLTTRQLVEAKFRIKERKYSSQQLYENYIIPLENAGYIDKTDNEKDRRSYLFFMY